MDFKFFKIILFFLAAIAVYIFVAYDLGHYLTLEYVKSKQTDFEMYYAGHTVRTIAVYMLIYILVTALSLPGATVMSLAGGALFGFYTGVLIISFASTIGATFAFLAARFVFRDYIQRTFGKNLAAINAGIEKDGAYYLFTLRLVPVFPYFVINLVMGLTPIKTVTFYWVSQVGMLAGTLVYVNAGTQMATVHSLKGILSPQLLLSLALLGIFPLIAKKIVAAISNE